MSCKAGPGPEAGADAEASELERDLRQDPRYKIGSGDEGEKEKRFTTRGQSVGWYIHKTETKQVERMIMS